MQRGCFFLFVIIPFNFASREHTRIGPHSSFLNHHFALIYSYRGTVLPLVFKQRDHENVNERIIFILTSLSFLNSLLIASVHFPLTLKVKKLHLCSFTLSHFLWVMGRIAWRRGRHWFRSNIIRKKGRANWVNPRHQFIRRFRGRNWNVWIQNRGTRPYHLGEDISR